ncbi:MAG: XkdF-like putative serine protease domain-containing protein [Clostridiales bacterium]|nr:XkdF-like putative serine protease domain-containing protein [Clostridiales bacterium]
MDTIKKSIEIYDAKISFVSLVDRPANRRAFLLTKSEDNPGMMSFSGVGRFLEKDVNHEAVSYIDGGQTEYEQHYVTGVAYEPNVADTDDNFMTEGEIEKMAHWFMKNGRMVDEQHSFDPDPACHIVESWIAPQDLTINDQPVSKGTWLVKVEVDSPDVWSKIETGDITGFSIGGLAKYGTEDVNLDSSTTSGEEGGDAAVGENNPEIKSEEKRGLWIRLAKALGLTDEAECIEKGAVMDRFAEQTKSEGFWNAFYALHDVLAPYNWASDKRVYESNPEVIQEALAEFDTIVTNLLTIQEPADVVRAISADAQQEVAKGNKSALKAGRKISAARMDQLKTIQEAVNNLVTDLDDPVEEEGEESGEEKPAAEEGEGESQPDTGASTNKAQKEEENPMTNEEMNTFAEMVAKAVAKEVAASQQQTTPVPVQKEQQTEGGTTALTKADVEKMITEAVQKAVQTTEEEPATTGDAPISKADVQAMIEKAVNEVKAARGLPTNLNDEGDGVQKSEAHDPKDPGFWSNLL